MPPLLPRPSFARSRAPTDDDAFADRQRHVDAGRIGTRPNRSAAHAAADAMARVVLGPRARRRWRA